jgi:hypothetical protein
MEAVDVHRRHSGHSRARGWSSVQAPLGPSRSPVGRKGRDHYASQGSLLPRRARHAGDGRRGWLPPLSTTVPRTRPSGSSAHPGAPEGFVVSGGQRASLASGTPKDLVDRPTRPTALPSLRPMPRSALLGDTSRTRLRRCVDASEVERLEAPAVHRGCAGHVGARGGRSVQAEVTARTATLERRTDASQDRAFPRCTRASGPCGRRRLQALTIGNSLRMRPSRRSVNRAARGPRWLQGSFS